MVVTAIICPQVDTIQHYPSAVEQSGRTCVDAPLNASIFFEQIKACGQVQSCVRPHNAAFHVPRARMEIRRSGPNRLRALEGASSGYWFS